MVGVFEAENIGLFWLNKKYSMLTPLVAHVKETKDDSTSYYGIC